VREADKLAWVSARQGSGEKLAGVLGVK